MENIRKLLYIALTVIISISAQGQINYIFHHLTTYDGLSNSNVRSLVKDNHGFLWMATESGLNRYDGYNFKVYSHNSNDSNSIFDNELWWLGIDAIGDIWINKYYNYQVYNREKDNFNNNISEILRNYGITVSDKEYKIYLDKKKDLWVFEESKAHYYTFKNKNARTFNIHNLPKKIVDLAITDNDEFLFLINNTEKILRLNKQSGKQTIFSLPELNDNGIISDFLRIYVDSKNGLWVYTIKSDDIYYQSDSVSDWKRFSLMSKMQSQSNMITQLLDDNDGNVMVCTNHEGLYIYERNDKSFRNILNDKLNKTSIASDNINCIYKDNFGVIWLGHDKKGISYYHHSFLSIQNFQHPQSIDVNTLLENSKGKVWLGTDGNGLYYLESRHKQNIKKYSFPNCAIVDMHEDAKGRLWVATYLNGIYCINNGRINNYTTNNSNLLSNDVWNVEEDRYGNIWFGTLRGGIQYLKAETTNFNRLISVKNDIDYPMGMFYDGGDEMLIGSVYGLWSLDIFTGQESFIYGNAKGTQVFKHMSINNVFKDKDNNIWLGHSEGITLWDVNNDSIYFINKGDGLSDNIIKGFTQDKFGYIWVTTSKGITVINVQHNARGEIDISTKVITTKDGLLNNYFNNRAIITLKCGDIMVGNPDSYTIINPAKLAEKNQPPAAVLFTQLTLANKEVKVDALYDGIKILEKPIEQASSINLKHNHRQINLSFTTGDLLNSDKIKYAYKLKGFDEQWMYIQKNSIEFSSLPYGDYTLFIKACNSDGIWNESPAKLDIKVYPPPYLSNWALFIYGLIFIGIVAFIIHFTRKRHSNKLELQRLQMERLQEANISEMKLRFFTNISHDLRTPLTMIITPLQNLLESNLEEKLHKKLIAINKNAERLLELINSLLDFRKLDAGSDSLQLKQGDYVQFVKNMINPFYLYANERSLDFIFSTEVEFQIMLFDPQKVQKILQNLLSNAFKYTPNLGVISVSIYLDKDSICTSIKDNGIGISEEDKKYIFNRFYQIDTGQENTGSGIGLHIVNEYIHLHDGDITVEDNHPAGSIFSFRLPIKVKEVVEEIDVDYIEQKDKVLEKEDAIAKDSKPVLLFVDDNQDFCEFMEDSLSEEFSLLIGNNGKEAIELLRKNDVDIVVSDVMMPVMDGTELCKHIKENIQWSHIPVLLLTARTAEEHKIKSFEVGADDYLTKPFNFNLLKLRINKFLDWRKKCHVSFSEKFDISPSEITITSLDEKLIEKAIKVVEENLTDIEFSVEELSFEVGLSRSHLYKKLMSITGRGPAEFIRTIRLKRGRQLLEKSQMQISEIAYAVGFNSPKRFTINFKNEFGMLPSEFQKK